MIEKILERLEVYLERDRTKMAESENEDAVNYHYARVAALENAKEIVQEVAKEYGNDIILDYLQFVRDNADRFDNEDGWSLSDLIILATEYQKGE